MAIINVLLLTDAGGASLSREDQAAITRGLPPGFGSPIYYDGKSEFNFAKKSHQWDSNESYTKWPIYVANETMGGKPRYGAVMFYGLSVETEGSMRGYRLGPVNLKVALQVIKAGRSVFIFNGIDVIRVELKAEGRGRLMTYEGQQRIRNGMMDATFGFIVDTEEATEEGPE